MSPAGGGWVALWKVDFGLRVLWPVRQTTGFARMPGAGQTAFSVVGSGPALVLPAWWVSHVVEDWQFEPLRRFVEGLAVDRTVVRYDRIGTGLSARERPGETFTPEFEMATLCAVLDELALERVTLMGISCVPTGDWEAACWRTSSDRVGHSMNALPSPRSSAPRPTQKSQPLCWS